jgi:hypothetical protein
MQLEPELNHKFTLISPEPKPLCNLCYFFIVLYSSTRWKRGVLDQNGCHNHYFYKWWIVIESYMIIVLNFLCVDLNMCGSLYMWCYMMWKNWCDENAMWKWIYATRSYQLLIVGFRPSWRWMDTMCLPHELRRMMQYLLPLCFV